MPKHFCFNVLTREFTLPQFSASRTPPSPFTTATRYMKVHSLEAAKHILFAIHSRGRENENGWDMGKTTPN